MHNYIEISKAQSTGTQEIPNLTIDIDCEIGDAGSLEAARLTYEHQGKQLELALYNSLPGGTYDQLLVAMMERKASLFKVSFADQE